MNNKIQEKDHFFVWPENFLLQIQDKIIGLQKDDQTQVLLKALGNDKNNENVIFIHEIDAYDTLFLKEVSPGFYKVSDLNHTVFVFTKNFEKIFELPSISFENDWWILEKTIVPKTIPFPKKGIIFLGSNPGKSLIEFCKEQNIPLIITKKSFWSLENEESEKGFIRRILYP